MTHSSVSAAPASENSTFDIRLIDQLDDEHRDLALNRLHFLNFVESIRPLKRCKCPDGEPTPILTEGPPQDPGAKRRIECGICHDYIAWLSKDPSRLRRKKSTMGLAVGDFCQCCRRTEVPLTGHHVVEVQEGGTGEPENIWSVCEQCHTVIHTLRRIAGFYRQEAASCGKAGGA